MFIFLPNIDWYLNKKTYISLKFGGMKIGYGLIQERYGPFDCIKFGQFPWNFFFLPYDGILLINQISN